MGVATVVEQQSSPPVFSTARKQVWLVWFILPAVFLALYGLFVRAAGPHYLGSKSDPDYIYICNSLNMAVGWPPDSFHHPGTSVQLLGAIVITLAHPFAGSAEKIDSVLRNPEPHLAWINLAGVAIYAISLALVGLTVWRRTGDWQSALLLQAAPFLLGDRFRFVARIGPEPALFVIGLLMATLLFLEVRNESDHIRARTLAVLGLVAATGVMTKLNFFPLALVPLAALRNWKQRGTFLLWSGAFGFLWLLPLLAHANELFAWVTGLAFRQGKWGSGQAGILPPDYLSALGRFVAGNLWLSVADGVSWATTAYGCTRWKQQTPQERRWLLLLGGLAFAQTLEMVLVAKYGAPRYAIPALVLCPLNLLLLIGFWSSRLPSLRRVFWGAGLVVVLISAATLPSHYSTFSRTSAAEMQIARALVTDFKDEPKALCWGSSSPYHALWFGNYWAGQRYTKELTTIWGTNPPRYVIHYPLGGGPPEVYLMNEKRSLRDLEPLHSFLLCGRATVLVTRILPPNTKLEKLREGGPEVITRVTFPASAQ